jgi:hypothetical protein
MYFLVVVPMCLRKFLSPSAASQHEKYSRLSYFLVKVAIVWRGISTCRHASPHNTTCKTNERMLPPNQVHHT